MLLFCRSLFGYWLNKTILSYRVVLFLCCFLKQLFIYQILYKNLSCFRFLSLKSGARFSYLENKWIARLCKQNSKLVFKMRISNIELYYILINMNNKLSCKRQQQNLCLVLNVNSNINVVLFRAYAHVRK